MFIRDEARLAVSFPAAAARLAIIARHGLLLNASRAAYAAGIARLEGLVAPRPAPEKPRVVAARFREPILRRDSADLALRWEADRRGGELFAVLDADVGLTPAGEHATTLTVAGVYRVPSADLGPGLDGAILRGIADETIRRFVGLMAAAITAPDPGGEVASGGTAGRGDCWPPAVQAP